MSEIVEGRDVCVACGKEIEISASGNANHKCPTKSDAAKKAAHTRGYDATVRTPSISQRLREGFAMLREDEP